jgi:hypothetical protein
MAPGNGVNEDAGRGAWHRSQFASRTISGSAIFVVGIEAVPASIASSMRPLEFSASNEKAAQWRPLGFSIPSIKYGMGRALTGH